jgi:hypothetical protein
VIVSFRGRNIYLYGTHIPDYMKKELPPARFDRQQLIIKELLRVKMFKSDSVNAGYWLLVKCSLSISSCMLATSRLVLFAHIFVLRYQNNCFRVAHLKRRSTSARLHDATSPEDIILAAMRTWISPRPNKHYNRKIDICFGYKSQRKEELWFRAFEVGYLQQMQNMAKSTRPARMF